MKDHQNEEFIWMKKFLSPETTAKNSWILYYAGKKRVPIPTPSNSSIYPLLKDVLHTSDMQNHLMKLCIEYTNTLNSQQVRVFDCSDQRKYALSKIIQWKYSEFAFPKVRCFVWRTSHWERIIDSKWTSSSRNKTGQNSR